MSIYATIFDIGDQHEPECKRMSRDGDVHIYDEDQPCTCGAAPIVYQGSHVLPSDSDKRGGILMLSAIPSHITRGGRGNGPDGRWWPWLRVDFYKTHDDCIVLTRDQTIKLRESLDGWITQSAALVTKRGKKIRRGA